MQTLARYQLLTTANAKQRRPLIMLETMVTPLATPGSLGIRLSIAMNGRYRTFLIKIRQQHPKYRPEGTQTVDSTSCQP